MITHVSIPRWYDYKNHGAAVVAVAEKFQFQDGTIISLLRKSTGYSNDVSIPRWYDYKIWCPKSKLINHNVSIPRWYDYKSFDDDTKITHFTLLIYTYLPYLAIKNRRSLLFSFSMYIDDFLNPLIISDILILLCLRYTIYG